MGLVSLKRCGLPFGMAYEKPIPELLKPWDGMRCLLEWPEGDVVPATADDDRSIEQWRRKTSTVVLC